MVGRSKTPSTSRFGSEMRKLMEDKEYSVSSLSAAVGLSESHCYNVLRGAKPAMPEHVNAMASAMCVTPQEKQRLNLAAAQDAGFDLDLPEGW